MVGAVGLEPTTLKRGQILSLLCIPIPPRADERHHIQLLRLDLFGQAKISETWLPVRSRALGLLITMGRFVHYPFPCDLTST